MIGLVLLLSCSRTVPPHLQVPTDDGTANMPDVAVSDRATAVAATIGADPLARTPVLVNDAVLESLPGTGPLVAFGRAVRALERGDGQTERTMQLLEDEWASTVAVPLSRGYRLRIAENQLTTRLTPASADALIGLLSPLVPVDPKQTAPRSAMHWLGRDLTPALVRGYADQWVLAGWLAHPRIPTAPVADLLARPQYDGLRESPLGALLTARRADGVAEEGAWPALQRATGLALEQAAADRDAEQARWSDVKTTVGTELGTDDPIGTLLQAALSGSTPGAHDDRAAGAALLAWAALRWRGACGLPSCIGVDRIDMVRMSGRWHADLEPLAATWRVIALKESIDTLDSGRDTVLFPKAMVDLVDALLGTGARPLEASLLRKARGDGAVWLGLSRAVGEEGTVDWEGARAALGRHLQGEAAQARSVVTEPEWKERLERIRRRAIP